MHDKNLLLLFVRNPELGKVKTRLAASVGADKALEIYLQLLQHTRQVTQELPVQKLVYYSDAVDNNDLWPNEQYQKRVQPLGDLGEKMAGAFAAAFAEGFKSVVIIGSDCLQKLLPYPFAAIADGAIYNNGCFFVYGHEIRCR